MADYQYARTTDPATGTVSYDRVLTPAGDYALVRGLDYLAQLCLLMIDCAVGANPMLPTFGSPFLSDIGGPEQDAAFYIAQISSMEQTIIAMQAGQLLPLNETLDHFDQISVVDDPTTPNRVIASWTVYARSGDSSIVVA